MEFELDRDTINDLEIFSEDSRPYIFNTLRTFGGREMLKEMSQQPLSNLNSLIDRRDSIKYFYEKNIELDITNNQLDFIEYYLKFNKRYLRRDIVSFAFDCLYNKIQITPDYYRITTGIKYLIQLIRFAYSLMSKIEKDEAAPYLSGKFKNLKILFNHQYIKPFLSPDSKVTLFQIHRLDLIFRKQELKNVKELLIFIYEMDVFESAAEVVKLKGWSFPEYNDSEKLLVNFHGLFHPAIKDSISNDIFISEETSVVFLTGPNMAGKSTLLKSIGLSIYLAHIGFPVPAKAMETTVFNGLITTINLPDNLIEGLSHFLSEVTRIKKIALKVVEKGRLFIIIDELFRGTNPHDAYEASLLTIKTLSKVKNCVFVISSHLSELADQFQNNPNISFKYLQSNFREDNLSFDFKLKNGVNNERLGMYYIEKSGIIEILAQTVTQDKIL